MVMKIKLRSEEEGVTSKADPKSLINTVKAFVGQAMMKLGAPGAFSIPVNIVTGKGDVVQGEIEFKAIPSAMDGHFLYNMSGNLAVGKLPPLRVNGNVALPKEDKYYLDSDTAKVYAIAKKKQMGKALSDAERALLDAALTGSSDDDTALSAGEDTGEEVAATE